MRQLDLFGNVIKTTSAEENHPVTYDQYSNMEYGLATSQKPERAGREAMEEPIFDTTKAATMENLNVTSSKQTPNEMQSEHIYNDNHAEQTFSEAEVNNAEKAATESLQEQIIEIPGADEVLTVAPVETIRNFGEEKRSDELSGAEIFNDGKIRIKIKPKVPEVAVVEIEKEDVATIEEEKEEVAIIEEEEKKEGQQNLIQKRGRKSFKEIDAEVDLIEIPEDEVLFERQYYSISHVAEWFKVNTSLIRFWENEFDILKPKKNRKGDRLFRPEDVKNLQLIYHLLRQRKYTIEGAKEFIRTNKIRQTCSYS
jgi:hypothetical protein